MSMKYKLEYIYSKLNIYTFKLECIYIYVCVCSLSTSYQKNALFPIMASLPSYSFKTKFTIHSTIRNLKESSRLYSFCNL